MTQTDDFLEHYGVKGMKWGVRKDNGYQGQQVSIKKLNKLDKKFEKIATGSQGFAKIHNEAARRNYANIERINHSAKFKGADFRQGFDSPLGRAYLKAHQDAYMSAVKSTAKDFGVNPSGTKKVTIDDLGNGQWRVSLQEIKHADDSYIVKLMFDDKGFIKDIIESKELVHDFLEHYGVKGMKWGIRKASGSYDKFASNYASLTPRDRVVASVAGFGYAHVTSKILVNRGYSIPVSLIGGMAAGFVGQNFVQNLLK